MAKSQPSRQLDEEPSGETWTNVPKLVASVVICVHLFAVIIAPLSVGPASELALGLARLCLPYTRGVAINNGYRFFAPNPGPSNIVRFEIDMDNGDMVEGQFPDRDRHWPRLLYHRHFMLSETVSQTVSLVNVPASGFDSSQERDAFDAARATATLLLRGLSKSLLDENRDDHGKRGKRVRIYSVIHGIPTPQEVQAGMKLDDPQLYLDRMSGPNELQVFGSVSKVPLAVYSAEELDADTESSP